jgi:transcriptional regulator with XRE-family HTH domain
MKDFTRSSAVLKAYRQKLDLNQEQFGKAFGVNGALHPQFVSNFERAICLPPKPVMKKIFKQKDFPKIDFMEALKEDLLESKMQDFK